MKLAVIGSRGFNYYTFLALVLNEYLTEHGNELEIVSGGARGADTMAKTFANKHNITFTLFEAEWNEYGKRAGILRNIEMAEYCDEVVAFWDGKSRGTTHMITYTEKLNKTVVVLNFS